MKNIFSLVLLIIMLVGCNQTDSKTTTADAVKPSTFNDVADTANYTSIQWLDSTKQELGKIKEGQTPEISWKFKNTGDKPLIIINAQGTCGCTIAEKPEQPVAPGDEGFIKAKFSSEGRLGVNEKQVIVTTNTQGASTHYLNFKVEVLKQ